MHDSTLAVPQQLHRSELAPGAILNVCPSLSVVRKDKGQKVAEDDSTDATSEPASCELVPPLLALQT